MTKMKQYRLDETTIKQLNQIQKHVNELFQFQHETQNVPLKKATNTDALKFAVSFVYNQLKEEGYRGFE